MENLTEILRKIRAFGGKVLFKEGDVFVWEEHGEGKLFIDARTTFDLQRGIHIVKPIAYEDGDYYYICPNCMKIHRTRKMEQYGYSFTPDCNGKHYGRGNKGMIHVLVGGKLLKLQIPKMRLLFRGCLQRKTE